MNALHIVLVGSSATKQSTGQTPDVKDVERAFVISRERKYKLVVHLIDPLYIRTLRKSEYPNHIVEGFMNDDVERVKELVKKRYVNMVPELFEDWDFKFQPNDRVVYLSYIDGFDVYDIMSLTGSFEFEKRWYLPGGTNSKRPNITQLTADWITHIEVPNTENFFSFRPYNLFTGNAPTSIHDTEEISTVKNYYKIGCEIIIQYLTVGFDKKMYRNGRIKSWTLNTEVLPLKGIIEYYGLHPQDDDRDPQMEILESADYRQMLTNLLIKILSNFLIKNNLIPSEWMNANKGVLETWKNLLEDGRFSKWNPQTKTRINIKSVEEKVDLSKLPEPKEEKKEVQLSIPGNVEDFLKSMDLPFQQVEEKKEKEEKRWTSQSYVPYSEMVEITNPEFKVGPVEGNPDLHLIDESHLFGGSKQRFISRLLSDVKETTLVYAGPANTHTQVALAYVGFLSGKMVYLFYPKVKGSANKFGKIAKIMGAFLKPMKANMNAVERKARKYARDINAHFISFKDEKVKSLYVKSLRPLRNKIPQDPKRIWIQSSTLTILSLAEIFPTTTFLLVKSKGKVNTDELDKNGVKYQQYEEEFKDSPPIPYNTHREYDGKVWNFVFNYKNQGDYIWNTGGKATPINKIQAFKTKIGKLFIPHNKKREELITTVLQMPSPTIGLPPPMEMYQELVESKRQDGDQFVYDNLFPISNYFTGGQRMECFVNRGTKLSPKQFWNKYREEIVDLGYWLGGNYFDAMYILGLRQCNTFATQIMMDTIHKYFKQRKIRVLDPSMGWGDRLIAAIASGTVEVYDGFDPNKDLAPGYQNILNTFKSPMKTKFYQERFKVPEGKFGSYDLVFTSPPFYDFEIYKHSEQDVQVGRNIWLNQTFKPYVKAMADSAAKGGMVCVYIDNISTLALADITRDTLVQNGCKYQETVKIRFKSKNADGTEKLSRERSLICFRKI